MQWVIDASVAAKWLAPEADSARAETLLDHELVVPDLFFTEVTNILWKKQVRGEMHAAAAAVAARWLLQVPIQVHETAPFMTEALELSTRFGHPAYDCFYLALARFVGSPMVTSDGRLFERLQRDDAVDFKPMVVSLTDVNETSGR